MDGVIGGFATLRGQVGHCWVPRDSLAKLWIYL